MGFRQGRYPDSQPTPSEKTLRIGRGMPGLNPAEGAFAVPLTSGCGVSGEGRQESS